MSEKNINAFKEELAGVLVVSVAELEQQKNLNGFPTWDSLAIVSTMAMIGQHFNVNVSGEAVEKCQTLNDLFFLAKAATSSAMQAA